MDNFKNFLKENNYENDLEFQLCDLELAFNAGRELQWKPSDEQIEILDIVLTDEAMDDNIAKILRELQEALKKLKGE